MQLPRVKNVETAEYSEVAKRSDITRDNLQHRNPCFLFLYPVFVEAISKTPQVQAVAVTTLLMVYL